MYRQTAVTNPACSTAIQRTFDFTTSEKRFWDSLPVLPEWTLREMVDELLDYDVITTPDPSNIAVPVAVGRTPSRWGWCLQDLIACSLDDIYPATRSGALHRFVRERLREFPRSELVRLPWSRASSGSDNVSMPPWVRDRRTVDTLEKSIRMSAWEALPVLHELADAEKRMVETSSAAFIRTGIYLWRTSFDRIPRTIRESSDLMAPIVEANRALEAWRGVDVGFLVDRMVLPHLAIEYEDEPLLITGWSSDHKAFGPVPELGLSAEDVATISDHVDDLIWARRYPPGFPRERAGLPDRCRPFFQKLQALIDEIERREQTCILEV